MVAIARDNTIFANISRKNFLGFKSNHHYNYKKVVEFLGFNHNDVSKISNVSKNSVRYDEKIPRELKDRIEEIANMCELVAEFFEGDVKKTALWFKAVNPMLGGISPKDMIRLGRFNKLLQFILDAREENHIDAKKTKRNTAA